MDVCSKRTCTIISLTIFLMLSKTTAIYLYTNYFENYCDRTIDIEYRDFKQRRLRLSATLTSSDRPICEVGIKAMGTYNRMMFYFEEFKLTCEEGQLNFFDGAIGYSNHVKGLETPLCGNIKPEGIYVTDNIDLNVRYTENIGVKQSTVSIIVTFFRDDNTCESYEYECENGRCIYDDINCSGYNPCGDHSDCGTELGTGALVGIGGVVGFAVLTAAIVGPICCYKRYLRRTQMQQQQAAHGTTTLLQPQPCVTGHQQAYPSNSPNQQYVQGQSQSQGQQAYPTQEPNMHAHQQTTYGVERATYT